MMAQHQWWNADVTVMTQVYDNDLKKTQWECCRFSGCFWGNTKSSMTNSTEWYTQNSTTVRIPSADMIHVIPKKSVVIKGACSIDDLNAMVSPAQVKSACPGDSIIVGSVRDNTIAPLSHVLITGA